MPEVPRALGQAMKRGHYCVRSQAAVLGPMRFIKVGLVALGLVGGAASGLYATTPAKCVYCPTYTCFGPCGQCSCMSKGPGGGQCVHFDRVQEFKDHGYSELVSQP